MNKHHNNFDCLRFLAAVSVWYGHCYILSGFPDPLSKIIGFEAYGSLGVTTFFIISGYFVTASYASHHNFLAYARNRTLRILPALCMVVLLSVFVLGPLVTSLSAHEYFAQGRTWNYLKSMLVFPLQYELPGVFTDNPRNAVNGSLWTLQQEVRLYAVIALIGVAGILRPRFMFLLLLALCAIRVYGILFTPDVTAKVFTVKWSKLELAIRLASQFACGALLYLARDHLPLKKEIFLIALLAVAATIYWQTPASNLLFDIFFSYIVVYIGFLPLPLLHDFGKFGDFSYGIYLYAFPVQQLCLHLLGKSGSFALFMFLSFFLTLLCGILSWHLVEEPALALKR